MLKWLKDGDVVEAAINIVIAGIILALGFMIIWQLVKSMI